MQKEFQILEFDIIINKLQEYALTSQSKEKFSEIKPYLIETQVLSKLRETSEARKILDNIGSPPLISMNEVDSYLLIADKCGILSAPQLEYLGVVLTGIRRLRDFLNRCKHLEVGLAYYSDELQSLEELREEIERSIRGGEVDDYASADLRDIRRHISKSEEKIKEKAEKMLQMDKEIYADRFVVSRNGHVCLPVKREYKFKINGSVIDKSSTGSTLFIEPTVIAKLNEALMLLKIDEGNEERKILYQLTAMIEAEAPTFQNNSSLVADLDYVFAKGKLSAELNAIEPNMNTDRYLKIEKGRHPLLDKNCIPLDFEMKAGINGLVITGPNTGGKTVAIKTVGLFSIMAQCGLHIPCVAADICMNSQVLCDIGDGQNITENLSTFSAHITNILSILKRVNNESLVIMDELGSGTDPAEGMGIAIAILEELKKSGCLFIATTHYPEVKIYAGRKEGLVNARMAFDKDTLKPLYRLEIGKAGESCALYIAKQLGMSDEMIQCASREAYGSKKSEELSKELTKELTKELSIDEGKINEPSQYKPKIQKKKEKKVISEKANLFNVGDSVLVFPEKKIGIVSKKANDKGEIVVQLKKQKILVNHKRLKLQVSACELYPDDYDFTIVFDTIANRKARHKMEKGYQENLEIILEEDYEY